jgi:hypothetical protein
MNTVAPSYLGNGKDYWYCRSARGPLTKRIIEHVPYEIGRQPAKKVFEHASGSRALLPHNEILIEQLLRDDLSFAALLKRSTTRATWDFRTGASDFFMPFVRRVGLGFWRLEHDAARNFTSDYLKS